MDMIASLQAARLVNILGNFSVHTFEMASTTPLLLFRDIIERSVLFTLH